MSDTLNHIDDYFNGKLTPAEKSAFENKCEADPAFADEVAFVVSVRDGLKQQLYEQKKKQFDELYRELSGNRAKTTNLFVQYIPYLAAACLLVVVALTFLLKQPSTQTLASNYISKNLNSLSTTMGSSDTLQMGVAAYNNKNYNEAERIFKSLLTNPEVSDKALANLGILYMITGRYDDALSHFDTLSRRTNLFANPGLFYKALVLMTRDGAGDKAAAKRILQEVIDKDLQGRREAEEWINKL